MPSETAVSMVGCQRTGVLMMDSETTFQNLLDSQILNHVLIRELRY